MCACICVGKRYLMMRVLVRSFVKESFGNKLCRNRRSLRKALFARGLERYGGRWLPK